MATKGTCVATVCCVALGLSLAGCGGGGGGGGTTLTPSAPPSAPAALAPVYTQADFMRSCGTFATIVLAARDVLPCGWLGQNEFREELSNHLRLTGTPGEIAYVDSRVHIMDNFNVPVTGGMSHGRAVTQTYRTYGPGHIDGGTLVGSVPTTVNIGIPNDPEDKLALYSPYLSVTTFSSEAVKIPMHSLVNASFMSYVHPVVTGLLIITDDKKSGLVAAAGNLGVTVTVNTAPEAVPLCTTGNFSVPLCHADTVEMLFATGRFVYAAGAAPDGEGLHQSSYRCGIQAMTLCILAPYEVSFYDDLTDLANGGVVRGFGTSFSAPIVTAALDMLMHRWPTVLADPKVAISVMLTNARDVGAPGVDERTGVGVLDFRKLFSPTGGVVTSPTSDSSLRLGVLSLAGLSADPGHVGYDIHGRDFSLATQFGQAPARRVFPGRFEQVDERHALSATALSFGLGPRVGVYKSLVSPSGLGLRWHGTAGNACYAGYDRADSFFGTNGTGSYRMSSVFYVDAGCRHRTSVGGQDTLAWVLDASYGRSSGTDFVDARGLLLRPSLRYEQRSGLRGEVRRHVELSHTAFVGAVRFGKSPARHSLRDSSVALQVGLRLDF